MLQAALTEQKLEDVGTKIIQQLQITCSECDSDILHEQSFACFKESSSFVTYRARLEGTSETESDSLISLVEEWVRGGEATIIVTGILMTVDHNCPVVISSFSEPECYKPTLPVNTLPVPVPTPPVPLDEPSLTQIPSPNMIPMKHTFTEDSGSDSPTASSHNSASATGNTLLITGGVVIVFLIVLAILIIVIAVLVLRNRQITTKTAEMLVPF